MDKVPHSLTLDQLLSSGLLPETAAGRARQLLDKDHGAGTHDPWFVRFLQTAGAWIAAAFFIGFLAVANALDNRTTNIVIGSVIIAAAMAMLWVTPRSGRRANVFLEQTFVALSIAGHLIILVTVGTDNLWSAAIIATVLPCLTYPLFPVAFHRTFSCHLAALTLFITAAVEDMIVLNHVVVGIAAIGVVLLHSGRVEKEDFWRPAAYSAVTILFLVLLLQMSFGDDWSSDDSGFHHAWIPTILVTLTLPLLAIHLQRHRLQCALPYVLGGTLFLGILGCLAAPILAVSLWIVVIGHLRGDRWLIWWGAVAFAGGLTSYYYQLDATLLTKSITLMALGITLLAARWALLRSTLKRHSAATV